MSKNILHTERVKLGRQNANVSGKFRIIQKIRNVKMHTLYVIHSSKTKFCFAFYRIQNMTTLMRLSSSFNKNNKKLYRKERERSVIENLKQTVLQPYKNKMIICATQSFLKLLLLTFSIFK